MHQNDRHKLYSSRSVPIVLCFQTNPTGFDTLQQGASGLMLFLPHGENLQFVWCYRSIACRVLGCLTRVEQYNILRSVGGILFQMATKIDNFVSARDNNAPLTKASIPVIICDLVRLQRREIFIMLAAQHIWLGRSVKWQKHSWHRSGLQVLAVQNESILRPRWTHSFWAIYLWSFVNLEENLENYQNHCVKFGRFDNSTKW